MNAIRYGGTINPADTNDPRTRLVNLVPPGSRVLEVGCGSGTVGAFLAHQNSCRVLALEPDPDMAEAARTTGIEVVSGRIEDAAARRVLAESAPYDAIIFADVIEHLAYPETVLRELRPWLASGGAVLASVPNVAHWSIRLALLFGRWDYTDGFLMDRTHLRWYTRDSLVRLFTDTGYRVTDLQTRWAAFPGDRLWRRLAPGRQRVYHRLAEWRPGLFGYQFVLRAEPAR